ncbi:predicted protein [Histoplasma mississippiense (nom. inval.)]|uniref:predicted protein n=1 Tax=Ajellomyces capsulatus (strain NAm1 / WU24) TaxID=2059318 RepID=UPI000157B695|nr:predicted protein [Histoplasma mississippiense (nom. inval.)]EDN02471.1 predicted protein [Histoplasma mississippiense (nom. inval.)]
MELTTATEKLTAIAKFIFPTTLKDLKTYLGVTGWLCNYIPYSAHIVEPLQLWKTLLLKEAPNKEMKQRNFVQKMHKTVLMTSTKAEEDAFNCLQQTFISPTFLMHHNISKILYIEINAYKKQGFSAFLYHTNLLSD